MKAKLKQWWLTQKESLLPARRLVHVQGDVLPAHLPARDLVLLHDGSENWSVGFMCPCGCGEPIELMLLDEAKPRWNLATNKKGLPSLHPSIFRRTGCRSHFWIRGGKVDWR